MRAHWRSSDCVVAAAALSRRIPALPSRDFSQNQIAYKAKI